MGALGMARMCGQIREAVEATALERASGLLDEMEREFERVRAQLSREAVGCEKIQDLGHGKRSEAA
ncbi:MAG: hypothetical protein HY038_11965 [Nitrospirae bacterium]|nr:hypothetical protein [Nitrospirota bacterium]